MTNTNLPDHWTPTELVGAPAYLQRAAKDYAEAYALAALAQSGQGEAVPLCYMVERHAFRASPHGQDAEGHDWLEVAQNENEPGAFPVYTHHQPAQPSSEDVRELTKWLNEESTAPINKQALARVLAAQPARVVDAVEVMLSDEVIEAATLAHEESNCHDLIGPMGDAMRAAVECARKLSTPTAAPTPSQAAPCKGMNCGYLDGVNHSAECQAEHAATIAGGTFIKQQAAVTELEVQLAGALMRMCNAYAFQKPPGSPMADPEKIANAALAAFEAKKEGQP